MSDIHYENRQLALWAEYKDLKGTLTFDAFLERHVKVNAYVVNLMREHGKQPDSIDYSMRSKYARMDLIQAGD